MKLLVPDWRDSWKWLSMHALAGIGIFQVVWAREEWPIWTLVAVTLALVAVGMFGRVFNQFSKSGS